MSLNTRLRSAVEKRSGKELNPGDLEFCADILEAVKAVFKHYKWQPSGNNPLSKLKGLVDESEADNGAA